MRHDPAIGDARASAAAALWDAQSERRVDRPALGRGGAVFNLLLGVRLRSWVSPTLVAYSHSVPRSLMTEPVPACTSRVEEESW